MKRLLQITLCFWLNGFAATAAASQLSMAGDLVVTPTQIASLFSIMASTISSSNVWDWPQMQFTQPYNTTWSQVVAQGPFNITFNTDSLASQVVGFELDWASPSLTIGQFQINDTITQTVSGNNVVIQLAGQCTGMSVSIPNGQWKVTGHLSWNWSSTGMNVKWNDFTLTMNSAAVPQANYGQCTGPTGLQPAMQTAFNGALQNQPWLQNTLSVGLLNWVQTSLGGVQSEMMAPRTMTLKPGLDFTWQPQTMSGIAGGLVRVSGQFLMNKAGATIPDVSLARTYGDASVAAVTQSGFMMPTNALQTAVTFMFGTGDLVYRITSDQISSFQSLMQSWLEQFFVWPDLMSFDPSTIFYFDITSAQAPALSGGHMLKKGGVEYNVQAPLLVHQWAPAGNQYLPYIDFTSPMLGTLKAQVTSDQNLVLQLNPGTLNVNAYFRPEFAATRSENTWIATSILGSDAQSFLSSTPYSLALPTWPVTTGLGLQIHDVQQWTQSFRVPLQFKNSN